MDTVVQEFRLQSLHKSARNKGVRGSTPRASTCYIIVYKHLSTSVREDMGGFNFKFNMTDNDKKLIEEALALGPFSFDEAFKLAEKADTPEARQRLENIGKSLHHRSEAIVGME